MFEKIKWALAAKSVFGRVSLLNHLNLGNPYLPVKSGITEGFKHWNHSGTLDWQIGVTQLDSGILGLLNPSKPALKNTGTFC